MPWTILDYRTAFDWIVATREQYIVHQSMTFPVANKYAENATYALVKLEVKGNTHTGIIYDFPWHLLMT